MKENLWIKINEDIKKAMKEKDERTLSVLRMVLSDMKNKMIELKERESLPDDKIIEVLKSAIKKRKDSIKLYEKGNREELAQIEKDEIVVIEKYLPEQMSKEEIEKIVREVVGSIDSPNMSNFGQIMGQVIAKTKGQADGNVVSVIVKKVLAS